ncbi:MAG: UvrD-helicase domain-containing protein [Alistipes sp.]|nr:UvrD-helicase domain-containing protein [Alistipes sp.]
MAELLNSLNEAQRAAVVDYDSPSLIIAGAGSGKTRVLTSRIAYMLEQGVVPWRVLALTFTNKAANEMRERIAGMVSRQHAERLWMGTFHSVFLKILRIEADKLGYPSTFTIYDTADSRNLLKSIIREMNLSDDHYKPAAIQARISLAKNNLVTPAAYEANTTYIAEDRQRKIPEFAEVYKAYARKCRENGAMDFDDLLLNVNILFKDFPEVLAKYQERFQYILVDEYQDTNYAQYIIIRRLAERHSKVCVVGDDAQSIYSFRGAKIENILRFRNDYPHAKTYKLEQNYRSTRTIVDAANSVIEKNRNRLEKKSFSAGEQGEPIKVIKAYTDQEEASLVADEIRSVVRDTGAGWNEVALLYRTNMQSRVFEDAFRRRGIPYKIYGGMSFYQRKEVKDLLAYFRLVVNPRDDEAFRRVINYPARGIGDVTVSRIAQMAAAEGTSMFEAAETGDLKRAGLNGGAEKKVRDFTALIRDLSQKQTTETLYNLGLEVATRSGIIGGFRIEQTPEAQSALENIEELLNSMQVFADEQEQVMMFDEATGEPIEGESVPPSLTEWLQSITLITDMDKDNAEDREKVTLMTVHSAKGLEYRYVFIVGMEENLFPSQMSMDGPEGIEEERRLFYVALTRACERAWLSFSETRFKWGSMDFCRPSRFLSEIAQEHLDVAFDLGGEDDDNPVAMLKRNYDAHNARAENYRAGRQPYGRGTADGQQRGGSGTSKYGRSDDGYGNGKPVYGREARRYPAQTADAPRPETVKPVIPTGKNLRSIGSRTREDSGSAPTVASYSPPAASHGTPAAPGQITSGTRVAHQKFGTGTVALVETASGDQKFTVLFDNPAVGKKTLLGKYARLSVVD